MSADQKAATERANKLTGQRPGNELALELYNLAAAFLEAESELEQERKAREKSEQFAAEETMRCLAAEQRAVELQARLDRVEASMSMMLEPLAALADASDRYTLSQGCVIPFVHDGDDRMVAEPARYLIPFLRKRSQPYYLTMRDACRARSALRALAAAGGQESAATPCTALTVASSALNISSGPAHTGFSSSTAATFEFSKPGERVVTNSTAADHALPEKYNELIMAVAKKWPGETRHQTALRYIQERERASYDKTGCAEIAKRTK